MLTAANLLTKYPKINIPLSDLESLLSIYQLQDTDLINCAEAFVQLSEAQLKYKNNEGIYETILKYPQIATTLGTAFVNIFNQTISHEIITAHINYIIRNPNLSQLLSSPAKFQDIQNSVTILEKAGLKYDENKELYEMLFWKPFIAKKLTEIFIILSKNKIFFKNNQSLYQAIAAHRMEGITHLAQAFSTISETALPQEAKKYLIEMITKTPASTNDFIKILKLLIDAGMSYEENPEFFNENLLLVHDKLACYVFDGLKKSGYQYNNFKEFYNMLIELLCKQNPEHQTILNILNEASLYAKNSTNINEADLINIINNQRSFASGFTEGPLNKNKSTITIENLIDQISTVQNHKDIQIRFEPPSDYLLTLPGKSELNLSRLIKNSNLTHLRLKTEVLNRLESFAIALLPKEYGDIDNEDSSNPLIKKLDKVQRLALSIYTGGGYKNINELFRSEALSKEGFIHLDDNINRLISFVLGCIVNDIVNKIEGIANDDPHKELLIKLSTEYKLDIFKIIEEKSSYTEFLNRCLKDEKIKNSDYNFLLAFYDHIFVFFPKQVLLDRGMELTDEMIQGLKANPTTFPALQSYSIFKEGVSEFHGTEKTRLKLENGPTPYPIANQKEGEVLLTQGTQVITTQGPDYLSQKIIRSPSLEPGDHYESDVALQFAYKNYLRNDYKDEKEVHENIPRPNHGLAHTYRVMLNIDLVFKYFAEYSKDEEFKEFCESCGNTELEWLRVAAAFSVTGRESEFSAKMDLNKAEQYREKSRDYFNAFINESPDGFLENKEEMQERIADIIRYMGNPYYDDDLNNHLDENERITRDAYFNNHPDANERKKRNFYFRILTIAHKLDLVRCFTKDEYKAAMHLCDQLSVNNPAQKDAVNQLIKYSIELNKAHGNNLMCDIEGNGEIVDSVQAYKPIFTEVSVSIARLEQVTGTIPRPNIKKSGISQNRLI